MWAYEHVSAIFILPCCPVTLNTVYFVHIFASHTFFSNFILSKPIICVENVKYMFGFFAINTCVIHVKLRQTETDMTLLNHEASINFGKMKTYQAIFGPN